MVTYAALLIYMGIASLAGFVAGVIIGCAFSVGHPRVLEAWEQYRMAHDTRVGVNAALKKLREALPEPPKKAA